MDASKQQEQRSATSAAAGTTQASFVVELSAGASPLHVLHARICDISLFKDSTLYHLGALAALNAPSSALSSFQMLLCNILSSFDARDQQLEAFRRLFPNVTFTSRHALRNVSPSLYTLTPNTSVNAQTTQSTRPASPTQTAADAAHGDRHDSRQCGSKKGRRSHKVQKQHKSWPDAELRTTTCEEKDATSALLQLARSLPAGSKAKRTSPKTGRLDGAVTAPSRRHSEGRRSTKLQRPHALAQIRAEGTTSPLSDASGSTSTSPTYDASFNTQ